MELQVDIDEIEMQREYLLKDYYEELDQRFLETEDLE